MGATEKRGWEVKETGVRGIHFMASYVDMIDMRDTRILN